MPEVACCPLTANAPSVPQVYLFVLWPTSTDGRAAPHSDVPFLLAVGGDKCVLCAALRLCLLCVTSHRSRSMQLLPVCLCCVSQYRQSPRWLLGLLEKYLSHCCIIMNAVSDIAAARLTSTGGCRHKGARNVCKADEVQTLLRPHT